MQSMLKGIKRMEKAYRIFQKKLIITLNCPYRLYSIQIVITVECGHCELSLPFFVAKWATFDFIRMLKNDFCIKHFQVGSKFDLPATTFTPIGPTVGNKRKQPKLEFLLPKPGTYPLFESYKLK